MSKVTPDGADRGAWTSFPRLENDDAAGRPEEWFEREFVQAETALGHPSRTALLVIDMQHDFCSPVGVMGSQQADLTGARTILPRIVRLVAEARRAGALVVFLQNVNLPHAHSSSDAEIGRRVARRTPPDITLKDSWGAQFVPELAPRADDVVVAKHRRSGFLHTDLEMILRASRRDVVLCVGMVTSACVISTALDAAQRDFYCYVVEDCVAAYDSGLHEAAMTVLRGQVAGTVQHTTVIDGWTSATQPVTLSDSVTEDAGSGV